jgi:hypothetical protein
LPVELEGPAGQKPPALERPAGEVVDDFEFAAGPEFAAPVITTPISAPTSAPTSAPASAPTSGVMFAPTAAMSTDAGISTQHPVAAWADPERRDPSSGQLTERRPVLGHRAPATRTAQGPAKSDSTPGTAPVVDRALDVLASDAGQRASTAHDDLRRIRRAAEKVTAPSAGRVAAVNSESAPPAPALHRQPAVPAHTAGLAGRNAAPASLNTQEHAAEAAPHASTYPQPPIRRRGIRNAAARRPGIERPTGVAAAETGATMSEPAPKPAQTDTRTGASVVPAVLPSLPAAAGPLRRPLVGGTTPVPRPALPSRRLGPAEPAAVTAPAPFAAPAEYAGYEAGTHANVAPPTRAQLPGPPMSSPRPAMASAGPVEDALPFVPEVRSRAPQPLTRPTTHLSSRQFTARPAPDGVPPATPPRSRRLTKAAPRVKPHRDAPSPVETVPAGPPVWAAPQALYASSGGAPPTWSEAQDGDDAWSVIPESRPGMPTQATQASQPSPADVPLITAKQSVRRDLAARGPEDPNGAERSDDVIDAFRRRQRVERDRGWQY